jgi:uncharacterized protein (TIGR02001 family)
MMKKTLIATALLAASTGALAEIAGNVKLATDYRFRGISQTDNDAAIQGGFDYTNESGLYAGVWASNLQFAGSIEMDYYAGLTGELANGLGYNVGVIYYDYPSDNSTTVDLEYTEVYGGLSGKIGEADISGKISYSPDYFAETGTGFYYEAAAGFALPVDFGLSAHVGYQTIDEGAASQKGFFSSEEDSYLDWSLGITKSISGVDLGLTYVDTDLDDTDCFSSSICDSTVVFTVSKAL